MRFVLGRPAPQSVVVRGHQSAAKQDFEAGDHGFPRVYADARTIRSTSYAFENPLEDVAIRGCRFAMFQHPVQRELADRPVLRRISVERCHFTASEVGPFILEDSMVDTIWFHRGKWGPQQLAGCAFKHVVIRGPVRGGLRFVASRDWWRHHILEPATSDATVIANERYYAEVDWALDISEAEFTGVEMYRSGIPARLVRRDPDTQVVVTRASVANGDWRAACEGSSVWVGMERFLSSGFQDAVLIAEKRAKYLAADVAAFGRLRDIGVVVDSVPGSNLPVA
jgi:hypothetical protein